MQKKKKAKAFELKCLWQCSAVAKDEGNFSCPDDTRSAGFLTARLEICAEGHGIQTTGAKATISELKTTEEAAR